MILNKKIILMLTCILLTGLTSYGQQLVDLSNTQEVLNDTSHFSNEFVGASGNSEINSNMNSSSSSSNENSQEINSEESIPDSMENASRYRKHFKFGLTNVDYNTYDKAEFIFSKENGEELINTMINLKGTNNSPVLINFQNSDLFFEFEKEIITGRQYNISIKILDSNNQVVKQITEITYH